MSYSSKYGLLSRHRNLSSCTSLYTTVCLVASSRNIVQSHRGSGLRSILDQYDTAEKRKVLFKNKNGNYYRFQQKLWPSTEALETELTKLHYSPVERTPHHLLPMRKEAPAKYFTCEGRGGVALLENVEEQMAGEEERLRGDSATASNISKEDEEQNIEMLNMLAEAADAPIGAKIFSDMEVEGTLLASSTERARNVIASDLMVNTLALRPTEQEIKGTVETKTSRDLAGSSWNALGLDPFISDAANQLYGPVPSRLQSRLIPALVNEDHNDVLLNGVTGSGKTTSLILSMLQGIRNETQSFNVLVATDTINAMRMYDQVRALCRRAGGGRLVDRPAEDYSWLFIGTFREDCEKYYQMLRRGLHGPHGPARLFITTADVMAELMFDKKMEFEDFGYLRRVYLDDIGVQIPLLPERAPVEAAKERAANPLAAELLLGTLHQLPGPHIRSILQLGLVSADVDIKLKKHLQLLCLKPEAQTVIMSPIRIPSTIHCLFSFYLLNQDRFEFVTRLMWNARETIPGRGIIFIRQDEDVLNVRRKLRALGMNAKIFSEVYGDGSFKDKWKFLILKESEAFGLDIPLVSHVFITFSPSSWQSYLHMCGRTGRLGNVGWVYTVTDKRDAKQVRQVAEDLDVDFIHHVVTQDLSPVKSSDVDRFTKEPEYYGLDPQYVVKQHYEVQSENPDFAYHPREFFSKPNVKKNFMLEDYTPVNVKQRRFDSATALAKDIENNPTLVSEMRDKGYLDDRMRATKKLKSILNFKQSKKAPSPFEKRRR